jgi:hypothetical protein
MVKSFFNECHEFTNSANILRGVMLQAGFVDIDITAQNKQWLSTDEIPENTLFSALVSAHKPR